MLGSAIWFYKMPLKDFYQELKEINVVLTPQQEKFFFQQMEIIIKSTTDQESELWSIVPMNTSTLQLLHVKLMDHC